MLWQGKLYTQERYYGRPDKEKPANKPIKLRYQHRRPYQFAGYYTIRQDSEGNWNARVGFDGYDRKGVPNQLKARVMESGSSRQKKKPFVRPAIAQATDKAKAVMENTILEETHKIMGGK
jgi:hypothetical protein